jgi:hypothetical protein
MRYLQTLGFWRFSLALMVFSVTFVVTGALWRGDGLERVLTWGIPIGMLAGFAAGMYGWFTWLRPKK